MGLAALIFALAYLFEYLRKRGKGKVRGFKKSVIHLRKGR
jgi:hypothetical protein